MNSQVTFREFKFMQQCSIVWNTMTIEQRRHYRCLIDFVTAFCELTHEEFSYDEKCNMLDYIARNDTQSQHEWQKAIKDLDKFTNGLRK